MGIDPSVAEQIRAALSAIEREQDCRVCLAVESGSRAWGFESSDSDYDVRFIYARHWHWYLSTDLEAKRDVIEVPITSDLDISGWDIRKALMLLKKSNPPLLEWLQSPLVYFEEARIAARLRQLAPHAYSPRACFHHYLHMAQGNFREFLRGEIVWRKKYFYVLRPLLAMRWIERGLGAVPIEFEKLLSATLSAGPLLDEIHALLAQKRAGAELDRGSRAPLISEFIETELARLEQVAGDQPAARVSQEALDECFRASLADAWGSMLSPEGRAQS